MNKILKSTILLLLFTYIAQAQQAAPTFLYLSADKSNQIVCDKVSNNTIEIKTTGNDPYIRTQMLKQALPATNRVLSFEYFCPKGIKDFQVFFSPPESETKSSFLSDIDMAEGWTTYSADLSEIMENWGKPGDYLRLDFGRQADISIQLRNLQIRTFTAHEKEIANNREANKYKNNKLHQDLKAYLESDYNSKITEVSCSKEKIFITGTASSIKNTYLCEIPPYLNINDIDQLPVVTAIQKSNFSTNIPRYTQYNNLNYDRILSKWAIITINNSQRKLISHAHHPDNIEPENNLPKETPAGRKGIGGFNISRGHIDDLTELNITSVTVNIPFGQYLLSSPTNNCIGHNYNGKIYYFDKNQIYHLDNTLKETAKRNIIVAAILLVNKGLHFPGSLLQHPDMDPSGIYSMPNMTTPQSVNCYAACLDFMAQRYSRPDKKYGTIHHWIMHNEVDAGWTWTNMGQKTDLVFMDTYIKSMRMCYAIARNYNPHSEVFISLTHYWNWTVHPKYYPSKKLIDILINFSNREGDFQWAVAHHPYPQNLMEPKTWQDDKAQFTTDTPLITFKNLKVLDNIIKSPEMLYLGKYKRTLWLSENGTNSKTYSNKDLEEQAAGFAFAWKTMKQLDGIDGFQWHNWIDNRHEGGLRIGLRKFPDYTEDPAGKKPVWYAYQAADTKNENAVFMQYLETIGIKSWPELTKYEK